MVISATAQRTDWRLRYAVLRDYSGSARAYQASPWAMCGGRTLHMVSTSSGSTSSDSASAGSTSFDSASFGPFHDAVSDDWRKWRERTDLDEYDARWERLAQAGEAVHGEVDLIHSLGPETVLDAGCGTGRIALELRLRGIDVVGVDLDRDLLARARRRAPMICFEHDDLATMQLDRQFELVAMPGNVMNFCRPTDRRLVVHNLAQHLRQGGLLVAGFTLGKGPHALTLDEYDELCADCDLTLIERWATWDKQPYVSGEPAGDYAVSVHRRDGRFNVHDLVFEARRTISRHSPTSLAARLGGSRPPVIIDTRSHVDRQRFGVIRGSVHLPRTVVEWQLDPGNGFRHPAVDSFDTPLVVVCNGGYSSSLSAAALVRLGYRDVADLVGGIAAWGRHDLALEPPDHSHLAF